MVRGACGPRRLGWARRAYDASAALAGKSHWRGELGHADPDDVSAYPREGSKAFLSGEPPIATNRRRGPAIRRGGSAYLVADGHVPAVLRAKTKKALARCPKTARRQLGLIRVLVGDIGAAADLLSKAAGLGWSSEDHPGHVLFPLFAVLLVNGHRGR